MSRSQGDPCRHGRRPVCRHCLRPAAADRRGLCDRCYRTPAVRGLYPSRTGYYPRDVPNHAHRTPDAPTDAPPGTEARIRVLEARAAAGECLFHPDDRADLAGVAPSELVHLQKGA